MSETYNGWTNRETWALMLHVNNDEYLQERAHEFAAEALESDPESAVWKLEDSLQEWIEEFFSPDYWLDEFGTPMPESVHLMRNDVGSLWRVNWTECAESFIEDVKEA